jgi:Ca-activated chloride channel homolog
MRTAVLACAALLLQAQFRSGVDVVQVDVSVMRGGSAVAGLKAENFTLTDNGVEQQITSATLDQLPLSVIMVLDTSGSVAGERLAHLIEAGQMLVHGMRPDDRTALITFSEQVRLDVPLTKDAAAVGRGLAALEGRGATSLYDAVHIGMQLRPADTSRTVLLVFTDGADNLSWLRAEGVVDEARRSRVVIHAVQLQDPKEPGPYLGSGGRPRDSRSTVTPLQALATASGGRVWSATSSADLRRLFTQALEEMRARYLLTYTPKGGAPKDGWHDLKVTLKNARGDVTARPGYVVAPKGASETERTGEAGASAASLSEAPEGTAAKRRRRAPRD